MTVREWFRLARAADFEEALSQPVVSSRYPRCDPPAETAVARQIREWLGPAPSWPAPDRYWDLLDTLRLVDRVTKPTYQRPDIRLYWTSPGGFPVYVLSVSPEELDLMVARNNPHYIGPRPT